MLETSVSTIVSFRSALILLAKIKYARYGPKSVKGCSIVYNYLRTFLHACHISIHFLQ